MDAAKSRKLCANFVRHGPTAPRWGIGRGGIDHNYNNTTVLYIKERRLSGGQLELEQSEGYHGPRRDGSPGDARPWFWSIIKLHAVTRYIPTYDRIMGSTH